MPLEQAPSVLASLFARPCPVPAIGWHREHLAIAGDTPAILERRQYHRSMLAYLTDPGQPPLVSIVIPVFNRARLVVETVQSCLAQSWQPIEIIVVNDGSDDDPAGALRPFGDRVKILHQVNGGVSSARNRGIREARGAFVHLLDSDDVLQPDAIERKVAAFVAIADADLCFSTVIEHNLSGALTPKVLPPDGSERCATQDLLAVAARRYPFFLSTVMMPRWAMLAAGLFEEDLRRGEDSRFFFTIALRGGKAIGFAEPLTVRRVVKDRLSQVPHTGANAIAIRRRNLRDTLSVPAAWHFTSTIVRVLVRNLNNATALSNAARATVFEELTPAIAALGDGQSRAGLSPVMVLAELRNALAAGKDTLHADWHNTWRALDAAASTALASAARLTSADIAHWGVKTSRDRRRTFVGPLCRALLKQAARDPDVIRRIDPVLRHACPSPARESVRHYRLLRRGLRSSQLAAWLAWPMAYWPRAR